VPREVRGVCSNEEARPSRDESISYALPNKRLKLTARVDRGMNLSSARRSLSAIR